MNISTGDLIRIAALLIFVIITLVQNERARGLLWKKYVIVRNCCLAMAFTILYLVFMSFMSEYYGQLFAFETRKGFLIPGSDSSESYYLTDASSALKSWIVKVSGQIEWIKEVIRTSGIVISFIFIVVPGMILKPLIIDLENCKK